MAMETRLETKARSDMTLKELAEWVDDDFTHSRDGLALPDVQKKLEGEVDAELLKEAFNLAPLGSKVEAAIQDRIADVIPDSLPQMDKDASLDLLHYTTRGTRLRRMVVDHLANRHGVIIKGG